MFRYIAPLLLVCVGFCACVPVAEPEPVPEMAEMILSSPQVTNWGEWKEWEYCPEGSYVVGMQLKTEGYQGVFKEDTALNGVKFYCDGIGSHETGVVIASGTDEWGSFGRDFLCEGVATGFQLRSEKSQSFLADDTAANNLRLYCNQQKEVYLEGDGLDFGDWTQTQECFTKQAICGIQTQVETNHGSGDETALNNIKVKCCDVPDPAEVCLPNDQWDLLIECDNTEATSPTTCSYERKVGISHSTTESEGHYEQSEIYKEIGFSLNGAIGMLSLNFETNLALSTVTGHDWTLTNTEVWNVETTTSVSFDVPPGIKTQLLQTVGNCGIYNVKATRVKRIDTEAKSLTQTVTYFNM